jgi:transposase
LFLHCPDPYAALDLGVAGLIAFLREHLGWGGPKTAQKILSVLRNAPLPPPGVAARYAVRLQADFEAYTALQTRLAALDEQLRELVPQTDARFLASVPGISAVLAARYLAAIRTVDRFPSAAHIWSFAGLDPISAASGDSKRVGEISKKGPATFRDTLFQIGQHTRAHCAPIGEAFLRARGRGKKVVPATIHAAHKVNRLCFALLRDRRCYRPVAAARQARFQARWAAYQAR